MDNKFSFEKQFAGLIDDMLGICYEYVGGRADKIYIYLSDEDRVQSYGWFYKINGKVVRRGKLDSVLRPGEPSYNEHSGNRQSQVLDVLQKDWWKAAALFRRYGRPVPTEVRVTYDIAACRPDVRIKYEPVWSKRKGGLPTQEELLWFAEEDAAAGGTGEIPESEKFWFPE